MTITYGPVSLVKNTALYVAYGTRPMGAHEAAAFIRLTGGHVAVTRVR